MVTALFVCISLQICNTETHAFKTKSSFSNNLLFKKNPLIRTADDNKLALYFPKTTDMLVFAFHMNHINISTICVIMIALHVTACTESKVKV